VTSLPSGGRFEKGSVGGRFGKKNSVANGVDVERKKYPSMYWGGKCLFRGLEKEMKIV